MAVVADRDDDPGEHAGLGAGRDDQAGGGLGLVVDRLDQDVVVERLDAAGERLRALEAVRACRPRAWSQRSLGPVGRLRPRCAPTRSAAGSSTISRPAATCRLPSGSLVPPDWDTSVLITTAGHAAAEAVLPGRRGSRRRRARRRCRSASARSTSTRSGNTARHLTFFEMMGNFSFGDYFKRARDRTGLGAGHLAGPGSGSTPTRSGSTVYEGDERVPADEEAVELWRAIGMPAERIVRLGGDNFWQAGPIGPCGPCSELYLDRGAGARLRPRRVRARLRLRPVPGVLEPRVHAVQHARGRRAGAAAARPASTPAPGVERVAAAVTGRAQRVRDRRLRRRHRARSSGGRARATASTSGQTEGAAGARPTTGGPCASWPATGSSRATRAAATCCGGSCAGPILPRPPDRAGGRRSSSRLHARVVELLGDVYPELTESAARRPPRAGHRGGALLAHARGGRRAARRRARRAAAPSSPATTRSGCTTPTASRSS